MAMIQISGTISSLDNAADYELIGDVVIDPSVDMSAFTGSFNVADGGSYSLTVSPAFSGVLNLNTFADGGVSGTINYLSGQGTENFNIGSGTLVYSGSTAEFAGIVSGTGKFSFTGSSLTVTSDAFGDGVNPAFSGNIVLNNDQTIYLKYVTTGRGWTSNDFTRKQFGLEGSGTIAVPWVGEDVNAGRNGPFFIMGDLTNFTGTIQGGYHHDAAPAVMGETGDNVITLDGFVANNATGTIFFAKTKDGYGSDSKIYFNIKNTNPLILYGCGRSMQYLEGNAVNSTIYGGSNANATLTYHYQYTDSTDVTIGGGTGSAFISNVYAGGNGGTVFGDTNLTILAGGTVTNAYGGGQRNCCAVTGTANITIDGGSVTNNIFGGGAVANTDTINSSVAATNVIFKAGYANSIYGGGNSGAVNGDTLVTINATSGTINRSIFGGGNNGTVGGTARILFTADNTISVKDYICGGGNRATATSANTEVTIQGGTFTSTVFGAGMGGAVTGESKVLIDSTSASVGKIYGGGYNGAVGGTSKVEVSAATTITFSSYIFGGGLSGISENTQIKINGGTFTGTILGGSDGSTINNNTNVIINGGLFSNLICGGGHVTNSYVGGTASVTVNGGTFSTDSGTATIVGGGNNGTAANSLVTIDAGENSIEASFYGGGNNNTATVNGNSEVVILSGTVAGNVFGGGNRPAVGGTSTVNISGGSITATVYGGGNTGSVTKAVVNISGGAVSGNIYGGGNLASATADEVEINLSGGSISSTVVAGRTGTIGSINVNVSGDVYCNRIFGSGYNVTGNTNISVTGGTVNNIFAGGDGTSVTGGTATITVSGGTITNSIYASHYNHGSQVRTIMGDAVINVSGGTVTKIFYSNGTAANISITGTTYATISGNAAITHTVDCGYFKTGIEEKVYGDLFFDDYTGNFTASINNVNAINISGETALALSQAVAFAETSAGSVNIALDERLSNAGKAVLSVSSSTLGDNLKNLNITVGESILSSTGNYCITSNITFSDEELAAVRVNGSTSLPEGWKFIRGGISDQEIFLTNYATEFNGDSVASVTGKSDANGNALTVLKDTTVNGNVYGGEDNASGAVNLSISGGNYSQVFGGSKITSSQTAGDVKTVANRGQINRLIAGHAALNSATVTANRVELHITGNIDGTQSSGAWNYGAGITGQGGTLNLAQSYVAVTGNAGNAGNVICGGRVEYSGLLSIGNVEASINNNVNTVAAGSYINGGGTAAVSNATVSISAGASSVFGGGMVIGAGSYINNGSVNVTISGVISDSAFAGSYLTDKASASGNSQIGNATLTFTAGSSLSGGIYGGDFVTSGNGIVNSSNIILAGGKSTGCVFGGGYASGGTSTVGNAVITVQENFTLEADIYAGGFADGGRTAVDSATVTFSGSSVFSNTVFASGYGDGNTVNSTSLVLDSYRGDFSGRLSGDFAAITISSDSSVKVTAADLGDALAAKSGLLNVQGDTSSYNSSSQAMIFDLADSDSLDITGVRINNSALAETTIDSGLDYYYAWSETTRDLWVVGSENTGEFSSYKLFTLA